MKSDQDTSTNLSMLQSRVAKLKEKYEQHLANLGPLDSQTVQQKLLLADAHYDLGELELQAENWHQAVKNYYFAFDLTWHKLATRRLNLDVDSYVEKNTHLEAGKFEDRETAFLQGLCYFSGIGVPQNHQIAFGLFQQAAEQGYPAAQYFFGRMHGRGRVVGLSKAKADILAVDWYHRAAEQGHVWAQFDLGWMHEGGRVVGLSEARADTLAVEWYHRAAEQGHVLAQYNLGCMHFRDRVAGLSQAEAGKLAVDWYHKAAEQGLGEAQFNLGCMYAADRVADTCSDDARELAIKWYTKAAKRGIFEAKNQLARLYINTTTNGFISEKAANLAAYWLDKAGEQRDPLLQYELGRTYSLGGVAGIAREKADVLAVEMWRKAAWKGVRDAELQLFLFEHQGGKHVPFAQYALFDLRLHRDSDEKAAMKWFNLSPKEHLITYCNELLDLLPKHIDNAADFEGEINNRIDFINRVKDSAECQTAAAGKLFSRQERDPLDEKLDYTLLRVDAYIALFSGDSSKEMPACFFRLWEYQKCEWFMAEDAYHLSQLVGLSIDTLDRRSHLSKKQEELVCLSDSAMSFAADRGCELADSYFEASFTFYQQNHGRNTKCMTLGV